MTHQSVRRIGTAYALLLSTSCGQSSNGRTHLPSYDRALHCFIVTEDDGLRLLISRAEKVDLKAHDEKIGRWRAALEAIAAQEGRSWARVRQDEGVVRAREQGSLQKRLGELQNEQASAWRSSERQNQLEAEMRGLMASLIEKSHKQEQSCATDLSAMSDH